MRVHSEDVQRLSEWLAEQFSLEAVHCCGLPDHPGHALAMRQPQGFGGVLAFEVAGAPEAAWQFIYGTELISLNANVAGAKTANVHPASTTHGRRTAGQRLAAGISEGLVQVAVGLENLEDLQSESSRGFDALGR